MNILVSGCSHSCYVPTEDIPRGDINLTYSKRLTDMPQVNQVDNISLPAKDNINIINDAIKSILINNNLYDTVIIQLTEWERIGFFKSNTSDNYNPRAPYQSFNWIKYNPSCPSHKHRPTLSLEPSAAHLKEGGPTETSIGHLEGLVEQIDTMLKLIMLQDFCKARGIKLVILQWHRFSMIDQIPRAIVNNIDWDNFLIGNAKRKKCADFYIHLTNRGFNRPVDDSHYSDDAHLYIAKLLWHYIFEGKQHYIEQNKPEAKPPIYDYT